MKKEFQKFKLVMGLAGLAALALTACSVKTSGGGGGSDVPTAPNVGAFDHKVQGPVVEGSWASSCLFDSYKTKYKLLSIQFRGQSIKRGASLYNDSQCTQIFKKIEDVGTFRWVSPTSYGGFLMDYRLDAGNGIVAITGEELLIEGNTMYLSDFHMGFGSIDKSYPMKKAATSDGNQSGPQPAPSPAPAPTPGTTPPAPVPSKCADVHGVYYQGGYYISIEQTGCKELIWQAVYSDMSPAGQPVVYVMDGQPHPGSDGKELKGYYKESSFYFDFRESGKEISLEFKTVSAGTMACGNYASRSGLLRTGKVDGNQSSIYCRYWEKVK